jgi:hypothetical protein
VGVVWKGRRVRGGDEDEDEDEDDNDDDDDDDDGFDDDENADDDQVDVGPSLVRFMTRVCVVLRVPQPPMRPMFFDFESTDPESVNLSDQYMFGDSLLVAPVIQYQARSRSVYLPRGNGLSWKHYWNGEVGIWWEGREGLASLNGG